MALERERCRAGIARRLAAAMAVVMIAVLAAAIVVFRIRPPAIVGAIRGFNHRLLNPVMLRIAGRRHVYVSALRHVGRRSGTAYTTPVVAERAGRFLFVPLPYGRHVDWCDNVLAAGSAVVVRQGIRYETVGPEIVPAAEAAPRLSARRRATLGLFGVGDYLRLEIEGERPTARAG